MLQTVEQSNLDSEVFQALAFWNNVSHSVSARFNKRYALEVVEAWLLNFQRDECHD